MKELKNKWKELTLELGETEAKLERAKETVKTWENLSNENQHGMLDIANSECDRLIKKQDELIEQLRVLERAENIILGIEKVK